MITHGYVEVVMFKSLIAGLVGLGLLASQAYASELKIGSWGGNVRSGPSMDYPKIGSLQNGDPVVLLKKQKPTSDGFNWFKIIYDKGQIGYQWGGILCVVSTIRLTAPTAYVRKTIDPRREAMNAQS